MARRSDIIIQILATPLAFAVGILVGAQFCNELPGTPEGNASEDCVPLVVEKIVEGPTTTIYECPTEPEPEPKLAQKNAPRPAPPKKALPEAPPALAPLDRQRLLAWVRDQSIDLESCRDHGKEVYRLTVILHLGPHLGDQGRIARVDLNAGPNELPSQLTNCLRNRILRWRPPTELTQNRSQLVFGLTF